MKGELKMLMGTDIRTRFNVSVADLRDYCIRNNFYTSGTNEDYIAMFSMLSGIQALHEFNEMVVVLQRIAKDILDHTSKSDWILDDDYDNNVSEIMSEIMDLNIISIYFL